MFAYSDACLTGYLGAKHNLWGLGMGRFSSFPRREWGDAVDIHARANSCTSCFYCRCPRLPTLDPAGAEAYGRMWSRVQRHSALVIAASLKHIKVGRGGVGCRCSVLRVR